MGEACERATEGRGVDAHGFSFVFLLLFWLKTYKTAPIAATTAKIIQTTLGIEANKAMAPISNTRPTPPPPDFLAIGYSFFEVLYPCNAGPTQPVM
jgi:hypothetical protein